MLGTIRTSQRCPVCGGRMLYDPRRHGCFCETHVDVAAVKGFYAQLGRHQKRFKSILLAERHLNFIRTQRDHNLYDPRDWRQSKPLSLRKLADAWLEHKGHVRPSLSATRMNELKTSVDRICSFWGPDRNIKTIKDEDLAAFYGHPHAQIKDASKELSEKSVFNLCSNIQEFFNWGCRISGTEPPRFEGLGYEYNETPTITVQQQIEILEWLSRNCPEPRIVFAIQSLARNARVRPGELCEVKWSHIDIFGSKGIIYIHKRKSRRKIGARRKPDPKILYLDQDQIEYLKTQPWGNPDDYFMVYTIERSGVKIGERIHPKRLNHWFQQGAAQFGIDTYLYAGTKHTTTTALGQHLTREQIRRGATGHATEDAFDHYMHDRISDQLRVQNVVDEMYKAAKLKRIK
jgi:integrase